MIELYKRLFVYWKCEICGKKDKDVKSIPGIGESPIVFYYRLHKNCMDDIIKNASHYECDRVLFMLSAMKFINNYKEKCNKARKEIQEYCV